jgi:hypothetical protein
MTTGFRIHYEALISAFIIRLYTFVPRQATDYYKCMYGKYAVQIKADKGTMPSWQVYNTKETVQTKERGRMSRNKTRIMKVAK